jgi:uncharacterized membrane protein
MLCPNSQINPRKRIAQVALGLFMLSAGIAHLSFLKAEFHAQVPNWIPMDPGLLVVLSGWVEIIFGVFMLFFARFRAWTGLALALFFVAIFPGNISQYINRIDAFSLDTDSKRFARLFFQPVLIIWALWSTGAWKKQQSTER